ncbi:hypothetical protein Tco_0907064 [Tanacetum coccineum]|uniref:Reverse transcriptase domain-containing protein n=1 Tax=Tanacetum coccineum TaxID=301880 RepID=A0ABQ5CPJ4_9ASTR
MTTNSRQSKNSCMVSFQRLHSHLKRLSNNDLKGSRTENGFGRAFATLFGQDFEIFTCMMFLNMDQLQKQLDNNQFLFHFTIPPDLVFKDEPLAVPLEELHVDDKLRFVEEPIEIMDREVKRLKQSRIPIVKVRWNSRRGPEFTWEREDQFQKKYPHLFTKPVPSSSVAT